MVAAAHPLAAFAGARVLREGGNAFDAAVASAATLNVVEPFMSGLAGLGMATCYSAREDRVRCLDFTPPVPGAFDARGCEKQDIFAGARASGVPGNLAGWWRLCQDYGSKPFATLLGPAIELARAGFPVTAGISNMTALWWDLRSRDAEWTRVYTPGGATIPMGWVLRQPDLAETLAAIAEQGPGYLYGGALGRRMVSHLADNGGCLALEDLRSVDAEWIEPLSTTYRGLAVHSLPPPAESFQFLLTLAILEDFALGNQPHNGVEHLDTVFRAIRVAAEKRIRNNQCDPDTIAAIFGAPSLDELRARVRAPGPIAGRVQQWKPVDPDSTGNREYTTSLSVGDAQGNLVCITQSLGSIYGSGVVIPGTGVCMNNFLNWGDLDPESPNHLRGGGRLSMCLAPSVATGDGKPVLALGTPGSYGILQTQVQALVHHLDFGLGLQASIEAPRARLLDGTLVNIESRVSPEVIEDLRARGHDARAVDPWTLKVGGMQAVARSPETGALTGAADPRRDGYAAAP
jgi:gamma-glutamyltranspeptidase/glutathione hydrolase